MTPKPSSSRHNHNPQLCYLMQQDTVPHLVKIGVSNNICQRSRQLRSGMPFNLTLHAVIAGGLKCEKEFKETFASLNHKGEWFHPATEINEWLELKRSIGAVLKQHEVTKEFADIHFVAAMRAHLGTREPNNCPSGDLATRLLAGRLLHPAERMRDLIVASDGKITAELAHGYLSNQEEDAFKLVFIPERPAILSISRGAS